MKPEARAEAVLLGTYAVVLFSALWITPLWLDEILQFGSQRHSTVAELLRWVRLNPGASPLPYLEQHLIVGWLGYSTWAVRFTAALCSVFSGVVFAAVCPRFIERSRWIALLLFLALPIQFRYGLEARVYSQGLLISLVTLWLFLRLNERYSTRLAIAYGVAIAAGLYSQPLTVFPVLAQVAFNRRAAWLPACMAVLSYLPWYLTQHQAQAQYFSIVPRPVFFSLQQINPRLLLHEFTGGGYACAIPFLALAAWGGGRVPKQRLLLYTLAISLGGPILMDALVNYFFAERQLLFAMPALILLAAQGAERMQLQSRGFLAGALIAVFLGSAVLKNFQQATVPKDDLSTTADAIVAHLHSNTCVAAVPPEQIAFYLFLRPELRDRVCRSDSPTQEMLAVTSAYTTAAERHAFAESVSARFDLREAVKAGRSELITYSAR